MNSDVETEDADDATTPILGNFAAPSCFLEGVVSSRVSLDRSVLHNDLDRSIRR